MTTIMPFIKKISLALLVVLYLAAGANHFINTSFYTRIMPPYLPAAEWMVYLSGIAEMGLALLLITRKYRVFAAWMIALMLTLFLLVHVHMLQEAQRNPGYMIGPRAAWLRLLLQPLLILWVLVYTGLFRKRN